MRSAAVRSPSMTSVVLLALAARAADAQSVPPIVFPQDVPNCRPLLQNENYQTSLPPSLPPEEIVYNNLGGLGGYEAPAPPPGTEWPPMIRVRYIGRHPQDPFNANRWVDVLIANTTEYLPASLTSINRLVQGWMSINLEGPESVNGTRRSVGLRFQIIDGDTPLLSADAPPLPMTNGPGVLGLWDLDTEGSDNSPRGELNGRECVSAPITASSVASAMAFTPDEAPNFARSSPFCVE